MEKIWGVRTTLRGLLVLRGKRSMMRTTGCDGDHLGSMGALGTTGCYSDHPGSMGAMGTPKFYRSTLGAMGTHRT